jgi:hypothetical protein
MPAALEQVIANQCSRIAATSACTYRLWKKRGKGEDTGAAGPPIGSSLLDPCRYFSRRHHLRRSRTLSSSAATGKAAAEELLRFNYLVMKKVDDRPQAPAGRLSR